MSRMDWRLCLLAIACQGCVASPPGHNLPPMQHVTLATTPIPKAQPARPKPVGPEPLPDVYWSLPLKHLPKQLFHNNGWAGFRGQTIRAEIADVVHARNGCLELVIHSVNAFFDKKHLLGCWFELPPPEVGTRIRFTGIVIGQESWSAKETPSIPILYVTSSGEPAAHWESWP